MAQRVDFAFFPGVREENMLATLNKVYGHIRRNALTAREFRDWLKDENLWNKDEMPQLLSLCDIWTEGAVRLGPWAERFFAADTEEAMREQVYKRLCDENLLLVKYALEALDTEGGGRLHSTHELHRLLTSYVYPGKHVTLEPFKNWIKWAVVSGRVKMIGIRWGLTDLGKQAVPRMRTVDPDEFLEDEKAAGPGAVAAPAAAAPAPAPPKPAAAEPAKVAAAVAAKPAPKKDDDPDEDLDLPPEAEPVDDSVFSRYEQQFSEPTAAAPPAAPGKPDRVAPLPAAVAPAVKAGAAAAPAVVETAPAQPSDAAVAVRDTAAPQVLVRYVRSETACGSAPLGPAEVVAALRDHGRTLGLGGGSLLLAHGIEPRMAQNEPARHLFLAALVARGYALTGDGRLVDALIERTGGTLAPLALLLDRPEALVDGLGKWQLTASDPQCTALRGLLVDAAIGGRAIKAQPDLPQQLAAATASDALVTQLLQGILRGAPQVAAFWVVREKVRAGVWQRPAATDIAFVPWRAVRLMAYRLRLVDSHFADGPAMLAVARRLCTLFPPGSVEAAALEALAPGDHLRFDCVQPVVCQRPCAVHRGEA
ncbi:MAG: hypothetical protein FJ100_09605 [Deltaproteobacteria bacterium]|nr:hypothetical protein [Deltaproteobacteria bacterium]